MKPKFVIEIEPRGVLSYDSFRIVRTKDRYYSRYESLGMAIEIYYMRVVPKPRLPYDYTQKDIYPPDK